MTLTMPIEKMLCITLLVASHVNGGSTKTHFLQRQLGSVVCTEELCRQRYTNLNNAGTLTGYFYSNDDIPTKGCFIKGDSMFFGTGGTNAEMNDSDLEGAKTRVWCDMSSSNVDRSGNDRICSTEEQCKARYMTMKNAGVIQGNFYLSSDFPTKGCFIKGNSMYFGTGGTDEEISDSDLTGQRDRVWCSSNVDRSGNDRICSTEEQCKVRHTTMKNAGVIQGFFYASSDFSAKGCIVKGENVYFGTGGTDEEMTESVAGEQVRVWCDADKSSVVFEESTSEERSSGEDEEEEGQIALNDSIEDDPSFIEDVESGEVRDESGVDSQGFWSLYTMIGVAIGVAALGRHEVLC